MVLGMKTWAVFIDLDDTLVDTSERHYKVYRDILQIIEDSVPLSKEEFWNRKRSGQETIKLLPNHFSDSVVREFMNEWFRRIEDIAYLRYDMLVPQALTVLDSLEKSAELILVTLRRNKKNLLWELNNLRLLNYFKEILVRSASSDNKSRLIQEYLNKIPPCTKLAIIGDSEADLSVGKQFGMLTVAVTYGIRSKKFLCKLEPNFCLESLSQVLDILR